MEKFDIPVVLFIFKREKAVDVIKRLSLVKPSKLYILADQGRDDAEREAVEKCREKVEAAIDWNCELIKNYADENRGVYQNIGEGAKWVLRREKWAIFLEDDNLPEVTFFEFCKDMLERYQDDDRILWICGTNYLGDYCPKDNVSYVFTRHMLPCGWASWANKFERFYDGELVLCEDKVVMERVKDVYINSKVFFQYKNGWMNEYYRIKRGEKPISWDYQMDLSIKANNLFGICPCKNQIKNIGVDEDSTHGGNSFTDIMTKRFCGMDSYPMEFPLVHPKALLVDPDFENQIGKIILKPWKERIKSRLSYFIRKKLNIPYGVRIVEYIRELL